MTYPPAPCVPLDDLKELRKLTARWDGTALSAGDLYCTVCGRRSRMVLTRPMGMGNFKRRMVHPSITGNTESDKTMLLRIWDGVPAFLQAECLQCHECAMLVTYASPNGPALAIFRQTYGGEVTPHTPAPVAYYLDQAQKAHSIGANSAAVAMYRAALENLLFEQGYKGMIAQQLKQLEERVSNAEPPHWYTQIDPLTLQHLKDLGNLAIHANSGDLTLQDNLDADLVRTLGLIIANLLHAVYEEPNQRQEKRERLQAALMKKGATEDPQTTVSSQPKQPAALSAELQGIQRQNQKILDKANAQKPNN